jgi:GT2 family glycosyltransferase
MWADTSIDVVMLSVCKDEESYKMTRNAIDSLHQSEREYNFNIWLIETNSEYESMGFSFPDALVVTPDCEFGYNKYLNIGLSECKSEYVVIANNDLIFEEKWCTNIINAMNDSGLDSASPYNPGWGLHAGCESGVHKGVIVSKHICGWCMVLTRRMLDSIYPLDEQFLFWAQDDDMRMVIERNNFVHGLVGESRVKHLTSKSHRFVPTDRKRLMLEGGCEAFHKKWDS